MLRDKENDNPLWWDIHGVLQHRKGFVHYYYDLHDFIDKKIIIGNRTYKINLYDVVILQYLIGWQKKKDTCSFEAQETIEKRLKIKHGTFSDAIKKWRALGIIVYKTIGRWCLYVRRNESHLANRYRTFCWNYSNVYF